MANDGKAMLLKVLDDLEDHDARNLVWGLTEETWTRVRICERIADSAPNEDPEGVLEQLLNHCLVFELDQTWPQEYRTRMSESMRLLARLRQQFPRRPWQSAPRLVADFRFRHEPRRFPRRYLTTAELTTRLTASNFGPAEIEASERIVGERKLSDFQVDSTIQVLGAMKGRDRGVVVSAGTGSGKTLAFYLPALTYLATRPATLPAVGVVALYPRNELLKDQLASALDETRRLKAAGGRAVRIGAYFGPTPFNSGHQSGLKKSEWKRLGDGWVCPFLVCRASQEDDSRCGGKLLWRASDYAMGLEQLCCVSCGDVVGADELSLTRRSMQQRPPDLLFTTTEMLNRSLSDGWSMHVFGVGPKAKSTPQLVLLDEVHTYEGTNGAQVAYLLRRWRRLLGGPTTWVGLSATLANADQFFTDLCGLDDGHVVDVRPASDPERMVTRGREYQVVLRGDPTSQTALLSTTIQTLMLIRRVLDRPDQGMGAYGSRVFVFCDNLDVVNRLFRQYLNAEGLTPWAKAKPGGLSLAGLRMSRVMARVDTVADWPARDADGQNWWMPELLGFDHTPLSIGRTSSQDAGVTSGADVVVTTSSLEVGFDDPTVGAVVQHKAPRDVAQFLQRRGRAGRTQVQRPWTVVVLSDYGRDRTAYQDYEALLDPALPEKKLPLGNQSVRKMQAAMCMIDWMAFRLGFPANSNAKSMRKLFSQPQDGKDFAALRGKAAELLSRVMAGGQDQDDLKKFVARSLRLSDDEATAVCWEQPRSLFLDAVPTARRRLASDWSSYDGGTILPRSEPWVDDSPLPEFIPKALFGDLCLPEVAIKAPEDYDEAANVSVAVQLALNELAPGKVTLRWAVQKTTGLWVPPEPDGHAVALEAHLARSGEVLRAVPHSSGDLLLVRPLVTTPVKPDPDVQPSSNGRLQWQLMYEASDSDIKLERPKTGPLTNRIVSVSAYLHTGRGALRTWRYASESTTTIVQSMGRRTRLTNNFTWHGQPAAVGYEALVDAQIVTLTTPTSIAEFHLDTDHARLRQLRRDYFADTLRERLHGQRIDPFLSRRIVDTLIAAAATISRDPVATDLLEIPISEWIRHAAAVLKTGTVDLDNDHDDDQGTTTQQQDLLDALQEPAVASAVTATLVILKEVPDHTWLPWLQSRYVHTVAAAWQAAAQALCPEFDVDDDCVVDVVETGPQAVFILSDASIGGGGLIEMLTSRLSEDPRRFDHLVVAALEPSDLEEVDVSLRRTLDLIYDDSDISGASQQFRAVHGDRLEPWQHLVALLTARGVSPAHSTVAALASRVYRPRSSPESDNLLRQCLQHWDEIERRAGFAIDHRGICGALTADPVVRDALVKAIPESAERDRQWANSVMLGLLWPRAQARRAGSLIASNRFVSEPPATERTLVLDTLPDPAGEVDVDDDDWPSQLANQVNRTGRCRLVSTSEDRQQLKHALQHLATHPVELGWLHVHPHIEALTNKGGRVGIDVSLEEAPQ
jgi:superfamily II DNA or RNA helicase